MSISNKKESIWTNMSHETLANQGKRVFVGMSGGVDSSVSAYLLKQAGYNVVGVFIKVWQPDDTDCGWRDERRDAIRVATRLDIPFLTLDLVDEYKKSVADYMISEYKAGRTPNPDVACNKEIKFGAFLDWALKNGANYIATGHYAQIKEKEPKPELHEGVDSNKDQSYFIWRIAKENLNKILFPIGHLHKEQVREIAKEAGIPVASKKDSQGVCFIGKIDLKEFLKKYIDTKEGDVLDSAGNVIGKHQGAVLYTYGERHGFTIFNQTTDAKKLFVVGKDAEKNTITVDSRFDAKTLRGKQITIGEINLFETPDDNPDVDKRYEARIRYRQAKQKCKIVKLSSSTSSVSEISAVIEFDTEQSDFAPGQSLVIFDGTRVVLGGIIQE